MVRFALYYIIHSQRISFILNNKNTYVSSIRISASNLDHEKLRSLNCRQNILYKPKFTAPSLPGVLGQHSLLSTLGLGW